MLFLLLIHAASASSGYTAEIAAYLDLACEPQCAVCHVDNGGGNGTVVQGFGVALMDRGLTGGSQYSLLDAALDAAEADGVDSDGDGVIDTEALRAGLEPNTGVAFCDVLAPVYGCTTAAEPPRWAALLTGGWIALARAKRRRGLAQPARAHRSDG